MDLPWASLEKKYFGIYIIFIQGNIKYTSQAGSYRQSSLAQVDQSSLKNAKEKNDRYFLLLIVI